MRELTQNEKDILTEIYGNNVDLNIIKITNKHLFSFLLQHFTAITFGNKIAFARKKYAEDFSEMDYAMSILVHEVCHVWQHQKLNYHWTKAMVEQICFGKKVYEYNILDYPKLTDFRFEQQGDILADYFRKKKDRSEQIEVYESVIYSCLYI